MCVSMHIATKVLLRLRYEDDVLELVVLDNGPRPSSDGIPKHPLSGFGLLGLRERIELLGGQIAHGPAEPVGYRVAIRIPGVSILRAQTSASLLSVQGDKL